MLSISVLLSIALQISLSGPKSVYLAESVSVPPSNFGLEDQPIPLPFSNTLLFFAIIPFIYLYSSSSTVFRAE
ncbi:hypothetical protein N9R79_02760 [Vibrio sp.]|nr:hypothetical protein [Vibrio sp.]